jgi:SAM-dependent methyltransferase
LGFDFVFPVPLAEGAIVAVIDRRGQKLGNSSRPVPSDRKSGDLADVTASLSTPIPDPELIFLVNGHRDENQFAISRRATVTNIIGLLSEAGIDYRSFKSILDFGCGCGRVLAGWEGLLPDRTVLLGCDINSRLIEFCVANIAFARTFISDFLPPINNVADAQVDFVYAASVFTHLTLPAARAWADEMARIIKPNGILMMSFSGAYYEKILAEHSWKGLRELRKNGFY